MLVSVPRPVGAEPGHDFSSESLSAEIQQPPETMREGGRLPCSRIDDPSFAATVGHMVRATALGQSEL